MESHEKVVATLEMAEPPKQVKDFDDLLPHVGEFGWYQRLLFLMMIPYAFFFAFVYFGQIFMTLVPEQHWCFVEELGNLTLEDRFLPVLQRQVPQLLDKAPVLLRHQSHEYLPKVHEGEEEGIRYHHQEQQALVPAELPHVGEQVVEVFHLFWGFWKRQEPPKQVKDFDDLLPHVGEFGWYQRLLFLMMIPYAFFFAFVYFGQIFMTLVPEQHWCFVEELGNLTLEDRRHLSIPLVDEKYHKCLVYDVDWTTVIQNGVTDPDPKWPTKKCEKRWEYNFTDVPYETIATELDWVCDRDNKAATAQSIFFCGAIVGGLLFGWIADKYGRVPALVGTNMVGFLAGVGTAFTNSFWSFCLCRFLVGMAYDNCFMVMYIVVIEYVGLKWRTFVANMSIAVYFTLAACLLPWLALGLADWRGYTLAISAPLVLAILTPWLVPESARWLISQGRIEESITILQKCGKVNGKKLPEEIIEQFREAAAELAKSEQETKNYSALDLFKSPRLRKHSILLVFIWCATAMVFDGHVRNVGSLGLDMFLTFTVATATEFPADVLLITILDILGRRWLAFGSMVISGVFSFLATTVSQGIPTASLAIVGRFAVNISYNIGMQYAAELLPTVVRAQGLALIHITGYVATILVPYIVYLSTIAVEIPLLILGALGILGGSLCLFLPESMGKSMPQTIQDGENYGREQKFWDFPCCGRKSQVKKGDVEKY